MAGGCSRLAARRRQGPGGVGSEAPDGRAGSGSRRTCIASRRRCDGPARDRPGLPASKGHAHSLKDEVGTHVSGELPADDVAREDVQGEAEEHDALPVA